jgi:integrase/recombinase XerD
MKSLPIKNKSFIYLQADFKEWLDILGYSKQIIYQLPHHIREFFHWLDQNEINQIEQIKIEHFYAYYGDLRGRENKKYGGGLSGHYLNKHLEALQRFMDYLRQMGNYELPYFEQRIEEIDKTPKDILSIEEVEDLYNCAEQIKAEENQKLSPEQIEAICQRDQAMLSVFYGCGLRRNEANHLETKDLDFDRKLLHVRKGKGHKERFVPFTTKTSRILSSYLLDGRKELLKSQKHSIFFLSKAGNPVSENHLWKRLKILQEASKMASLQNKNISLHSLRHSIATHLLQRGMKLEQISRFLGHSSLVSTQVYTHLAEEHEGI